MTDQTWWRWGTEWALELNLTHGRWLKKYRFPESPSYDFHFECHDVILEQLYAEEMGWT